MSCPNIESLLLAEDHSHLQQCEACRTLVQLHSLERPSPEACASVEGLLGLLDELLPEDSKLLHEHLPTCSACTLAYMTLVDDEPSPTIESMPWKGPAMESAPAPHRISTRSALALALALAAAALLLFAFLREGTERVAKGGGGEAEMQRSSAGASRPAIVQPSRALPPTKLPGRLAQLVASSQVALAEGRTEDARRLCTDAINIDALSDSTVYVCALASCMNGGDPKMFERLTRRIQAPELRVEAEALCAAQREDGASDVACDEVTCLVDPSRPCCAADYEERNRAERRAKATRQIDAFVEGQSNAEESVAALIEAASSAVKAREHGRGLARCELALSFEPGNQKAHMVCAIAACNLPDARKAEKHIAEIRSASKRAGLEQICLREGVEIRDETPESLLTAAKEAIEARRFAKGLALCKKALALEPSNQQAHVSCAIAACNLGDAKNVNVHLDEISSETRRAAVRQICIRQGVEL